MFGTKDNLPRKGKRTSADCWYWITIISDVCLSSVLKNVLGFGNRSRGLSTIIHIYRSALAPRYFFEENVSR